MIRGVYTAAAGLVARMSRLAVISNNLANAQTIGYKQDVVTDRHFNQLQIALLQGQGSSRSATRDGIGSVGTGPVVTPPDLDLAQGPLQESGNELDFALGGPGFFVVQTPDGIRYTREGAFERDAAGQLVTIDGHSVLGDNGPIVLPEGEISALSDGSLVVGGKTIARLRIVEFPPEAQLQKKGFNLLAAADAAVQDAGQTRVYQGFLEGSNVDVTRAMVGLIELRHAYSTSARMLQLQDRILDRAVNEVGRTA